MRGRLPSAGFAVAQDSGCPTADIFCAGCTELADRAKGTPYAVRKVESLASARFPCAEDTEKKIVWQTRQTGTLDSTNPWTITADGTSIRFNVEKSENCGGDNAKVQKGTAGATITIGAAPLKFDFDLAGRGQLRHEGFDTMTVKLDYKTIVATARSAGGGRSCGEGDLVVKKFGTWPVTLAPGSVHRLDIRVEMNNGQDHRQSFYHLDLYFKNGRTWLVG